ncbi:hypothetical protein K458DRAFT_447063 [Lentithecium fluviatile CBS 122367]|uniref:Survival Motor Neuron Gemin2-binding domain-containing protein n=1 Tax=Lentithecium fluviatile CBS 122367 TaxID=1168545 RepID=A0A6G1IGX5_9PLEO|nr:hypothetical protein K458DRAFT_447063 [Lentithecium fluviatile CBS 122367]
MPGISLDDKGAWDDSALVNSWDEAVAEYQKYHSIQRSGKRLEDVLSEEELKQLREEHGDLMEVGETADRNSVAAHEDAELPEPQTNGDARIQESDAHAEEQPASGHQEYARQSETVAAHNAPLTASMPQALLGSVQDENLKNLMMSWYYAGYYTGLYAGQLQTASQDATPEDKK